MTLSGLCRARTSEALAGNCSRFVCEFRTTFEPDNLRVNL